MRSAPEAAAWRERSSYVRQQCEASQAVRRKLGLRLFAEDAEHEPRASELVDVNVAAQIAAAEAQWSEKVRALEAQLKKETKARRVADARILGLEQELAAANANMVMEAAGRAMIAS